MRYVLILPLAMTAACAVPLDPAATGSTDASATAPVQTLDPTPPPPPPSNARTVEQFDTTSAEDRAAAEAVDTAASDAALGTTVASLGPPAEPGIWLKTPLVTSLTQGRISYQGNTINVELRPSGGAAGSGSQISLAAMRLIEAPLTSLPEITVYGTAG